MTTIRLQLVMYCLLLLSYYYSIVILAFDYCLEMEYLDNDVFNQYHQYYHNYISHHSHYRPEDNETKHDFYLPVDHKDIYDTSKHILTTDYDIKSIIRNDNNTKVNRLNVTLDNVYKLKVDYSNHQIEHDASNHDNNDDDVRIRIILKISFHNITNLNNILKQYIEFDTNEYNYQQIERKGSFPDDKIQTIVIHFINDHDPYEHHHEHHEHNHYYNHSRSSNDSIINEITSDLYPNHGNNSSHSKYHNITTIVGTTLDEFLMLYPWWYIEKDIDSYHISNHHIIPHTINAKKKMFIPIHYNYHNGDYYSVVLQKYPLFQSDLRYNCFCLTTYLYV